MGCLLLQKSSKVVSIDGYEDVPPFDEKALQKAVAHQPVSVAVEAGGRALQLYVSVRNSFFFLIPIMIKLFDRTMLMKKLGIFC